MHVLKQGIMCILVLLSATIITRFLLITRTPSSVRATFGTLYTNCYIVGCSETLEGLIIDPGFDRESEGDRVLKKGDQHHLKVEYIINTHAQEASMYTIIDDCKG